MAPSRVRPKPRFSLAFTDAASAAAVRVLSTFSRRSNSIAPRTDTVSDPYGMTRSTSGLLSNTGQAKAAVTQVRNVTGRARLTAGRSEVIWMTLPRLSSAQYECAGESLKNVTSIPSASWKAAH